MGIVCRQMGGGQEKIFAFALTMGRLYCVIQPADGGEKRGIVQPTPFPTGAWHHIAVSYDTSGFKLYRDGEVIQQNSGYWGALRDGRNPVTLGGNENTPNDKAGSIFSGRIARVRIYNRGLSEAEVRELAKIDR